MLNAKLVTARQEFPGFSFVDLYLRQSDLFLYLRQFDLFRENCDIELKYRDPYVYNANDKKETSYILSNGNCEFQTDIVRN